MFIRLGRYWIQTRDKVGIYRDTCKNDTKNVFYFFRAAIQKTEENFFLIIENYEQKTLFFSMQTVRVLLKQIFLMTNH